MSAFPETLFIETSTRCNLSCPMCARSAPGWLGGSGDMDLALFESLGEALGQARRVVLNGMGEPLLHPELPRMVALAKARQRAGRGGWCGLQTNGLLLDRPLAGELAAAGLDVACLSHDGGALLGHASGEAAAQAAGLLRSAAGRSMRIGLETVLMASNVERLPELVDAAAALGLDFLLATHLLPMDPAAEAEALFLPCSGASLRLFAAWQRRAGAEGLDLADEARAALRFNRSPAEARLLELARGLRQEARERGLWLSLGRLAQADLPRLSRLEALFAEARRRAGAAGLSLSLPALSAPEDSAQRRCAFVEGRAAFVDWRGEVSPCHFLWHGYTCRVLGDEKRVHPQSFGNIGRAPLQDIWNGPEFAAFRRSAEAGEYPPCGDCDMGMCSDACGAAGPFERDCLGVDVPCGHCPWALGQLQCLGAAELA